MILTQRQLRRGVHRNAKELTASRLAHTAYSNRDAKHFRWTKSADESLHILNRFCLHASNSLH